MDEFQRNVLTLLQSISGVAIDDGPVLSGAQFRAAVINQLDAIESGGGGGGGGGATTLAGLSDVSISSPTSGQVLTWDGSAWVAASLPLYNGGVS